MTKRKRYTIEYLHFNKARRKEWRKQEIDRSSWDQISTLFAIKGEGDFFRLEPGTLTFSQEHGATWKIEANGEDFRLYNKISNEMMTEAIEELMIQTPKHLH
jgi:hypothetical protein